MPFYFSFLCRHFVPFFNEMITPLFFFFLFSPQNRIIPVLKKHQHPRLNIPYIEFALKKVAFVSYIYI